MKKTKRIVALMLALILLLAGCSAATAQPETDAQKDGTSSSATPATAGAAKKAYRMFPYYWLEDDAFEATCEGLLKYADCVDEITLFCDQMNEPYMTDEMLEEWTSILTKRIARLRELGFESVGLNMLQTIGHGDYGIDVNAAMPFPAEVDYTGASPATVPCPRNASYREFIAKKFKAYAETGPDFIWVDDDTRIAETGYICFCDDCIAEFCDRYNLRTNRKNLVDTLSSDGDDENAQVVRRAWSSFVLESYCDVLSIVKDAVASVDPDIKMGLMAVHIPANAYILSDYAPMIEALGADMTRPGGGNHTETYAAEMLTKTAGVALQNTQLLGIPDRQYELEDFPQTYYKSAKMHITECTAAIMAGCNALAFASVPPDKGNDDVMTAIREHTAEWNDLVSVGDSWKLYGTTALYDYDYDIYADKGHYFSTIGHSFYNQELTYFSNGYCSFTPYQENSCLTFITEDMANALTQKEIEEIFSKGVIMDGGAARHLISMGYEDYVGASRATWKNADVNERYTDNALNGEAAGTYRYVYARGHYDFKLVDGAEALAVSNNTAFEDGKVTSFSFENELGGRVAVFGLEPWSYFGTWQHLEQSDNLIEWLTKGQNPVRVLNATRVASYIKQPEDRSRFMLMLISASLENIDELEVRILGEYKGDFTYYDENGVKSTIPASAATVADGYTTIKIPGMTGWGNCVLYTNG